MIFNIDIEKAMMACILLGKQGYVSNLNEEDFSASSLQNILSAMKRLEEKKAAIDVISVADELRSVSNALEFLVSITNEISTAENAEHYFRKLKEYTARRKLELAAYAIIENVQKFNYEDIAECKADVLKLVDIPVNDFRKRSFNFNDILLDTMNDMEKQYQEKEDSRLLTGFHDLDRLTAGLHPEELTIIAARPGVGKTVYAVNLIINLAKKGVKSVLVSREMSCKQLAKRIIANIVPIDGNKLRQCKYLTDSDWERIGAGAGEIYSWPIIINDELATVQEIRAYCRELKARNAIDVLVVDYLQLCRSSNRIESRRQEIEEISRQFKEISMELTIPVIALSQLTRDNAKTGRQPELHDLRESGSIEQDADNVIFLHIPKDTDETQEWFDLQIIVGKQRNGPTGYIYLRNYRNTFKLLNISKQR